MKHYKRVPTLLELKRFLGDEAQNILRDANILLNDPSFVNKADAAISLGVGIDVKAIYHMATSSSKEQNTPSNDQRANHASANGGKNRLDHDQNKNGKKGDEGDYRNKYNFQDVKILSKSMASKWAMCINSKKNMLGKIM